MKPHPSIARTRVFNEAAPEVRPFRGAPLPIRSNALPHHGAWEPDTTAPLGRAARARLARLRPTAATETLAQGFQPKPFPYKEEAWLRLPTGKFKTLKTGPRKGETVEETKRFLIEIWILKAADGTAYRFTSRSANVTVEPKVGAKFKLTPAAFRQSALRIWGPEIGPQAITFLLGR